MRTALLQDWSYVSLAAAGSVAMDAELYLDTTDAGDIVFFLEVQKQTLNPTIFYETAPAKLEALFASMGSVQLLAGTVGTLVTTTNLLSQPPAVPVAKWVRWRMSFGASGGDATFRVRASMTTSR